MPASSIDNNLWSGSTPAFALNKLGANTLILTGNNTYTGGTTINDGVLVFNNTAAIPSGANNITINYGGDLAVTGAYSSVNGWITSGKIVGTSAGVLALPAGATDSTGVSMGSYANLYIGASGAATFSGSLRPAATATTSAAGAAP